MSNAIQLSKLPPPDVVEALSFEALWELAKADFLARQPDFDLSLESSLPAKVLQAITYIAMNVRQRINDAARAVMLAQAKKNDLDNLGALLGVTRLVITPADPEHGIPDPVMEDDDDFRDRITLAPSSFSVAGPEAAYVFHARSASGDVLDASATSPEPDDIKALVYQVLATHDASEQLMADMRAALDAAAWPGQVFVSVLSRQGNGQADPSLLATVEATVSAETVRPLTDYVTVQSADIVEFAVDAELRTFAGPDSSVAIAAAKANLATYLAESRRLGRDITLSGLYAALQVAGIQEVILHSPTATVTVSETQAAFCTSVKIVDGGVGE